MNATHYGGELAYMYNRSNIIQCMSFSINTATVEPCIKDTTYKRTPCYKGHIPRLFLC